MASEPKKTELTIPKRPLTAFFLYLKDNTHKVEGKQKEKVAILGEQWKAESEDVRKKYTDIFDKNKKIYDEEFEKFKATKEGKKLLEEAEKLKAEKRKKKKARKDKVPKKPRKKTAYNEFVAAMFKVEKEKLIKSGAENADAPTVMKIVSGLWKDISPETKIVYEKKADDFNKKLEKENAEE